MRPLTTQVNGQITTYGLYDRFLYWAVHSLQAYRDRRDDRRDARYEQGRS